MTREPAPVKGDLGMLGQYGFGSGGYGQQRRAPIGFGGGGQLGSAQPSYGAYTPPQSLGQAPQTQYSSYTPPGPLGSSSQPMGASRPGMLNGETEGQTLGGGQYYHVQPDYYVAPNSYGAGGGTGAISRADASRLNQSSGGFMNLERLPGYADTNAQGLRYNMLTGLAEQIPQGAAPAAQPRQASNGLGGMRFDPTSNSWVY